MYSSQAILARPIELSRINLAKAYLRPVYAYAMTLIDPAIPLTSQDPKV